jgi:hypothetical protein
MTGLVTFLAAALARGLGIIVTSFSARHKHKSLTIPAITIHKYASQYCSIMFNIQKSIQLLRPPHINVHVPLAKKKSRWYRDSSTLCGTGLLAAITAGTTEPASTSSVTSASGFFCLGSFLGALAAALLKTCEPSFASCLAS